MSLPLISLSGLPILFGSGLSVISGSGGGGGGPTPGAITVTPSIEKRGTQQFAPDPVHFEVSISGQDASATVGSDGYDARLHEVEYLWDFYYSGTDNSYTYVAPTRVLSQHKNSRYAHTPDACHVYRTPGTYTVRCYAYEPASGKFGFGDVSVTVADADTVFPTTQTILVSNSGTHSLSGTYPSATLVTSTSSIDSVLSAHVFGAGGPRRVILEDDDNFTNFTAAWGNWYGNAIPDLYITRSGTGTNKPTIAVTTNHPYDDRGGTTTKTITLQGIELIGTFDDTTAAGAGTESAFWLLGGNHADNFLFDAVDGSNISTPILTDGASVTNGRSIILNDCQLNSVAYGSIAYGYDHFSILGTGVYSSSNAVINNVGGAGWGFRIQGTKTICHSNDIFRKSGWSSFGPYTAIQPTYRFNFDGNGASGDPTVAGQRYWVYGNFLEASRYTVEIKDSEAGVEKAINCIFDACIVVSGYQADRCVQLGAGGITWRNNIIYMPDIAGSQKIGDDFARFIRLEGTSPSADALAAPIRIYNSSFISHFDTSKNAFGFSGPATLVDNTGSFSSVTVQNNIEHQLGSSPTVTTYAPLQDATNQFTLLDGGYIDSSQDLSSTLVPSVTAGDLDYYIPETTSSAIGGAFTGLISEFDFYGNLRSDTIDGLTRTAVSIGPFEPNLES